MSGTYSIQHLNAVQCIVFAHCSDIGWSSNHLITTLQQTRQLEGLLYKVQNAKCQKIPTTIKPALSRKYSSFFDPRTYYIVVPYGLSKRQALPVSCSNNFILFPQIFLGPLCCCCCCKINAGALNKAGTGLATSDCDQMTFALDNNYLFLFPPCTKKIF